MAPLKLPEFADSRAEGPVYDDIVFVGHHATVWGFFAHVLTICVSIQFLTHAGQATAQVAAEAVKFFQPFQTQLGSVFTQIKNVAAKLTGH